MTRLLLITLLVLSSGPAYAEWVLVTASEDGTNIYVDLATIRRKGDLVRMWELIDYKTTQTSSYESFLSTKAQSEYDCPGERKRSVAFVNHSDNMGNGKVTSHDSDEGKWYPVVPGSLGQALWKYVCGKQ